MTSIFNLIEEVYSLTCGLRARTRQGVNELLKDNACFKFPDYTLPKGKDAFLYMSWIAGHGDKLINQINTSSSYDILPLKLFNQWNKDNKFITSRLSRKYPKQYKALLLEHLKPLKGRIKGVIFTFDWHPAMRVLSEACENLGIQRFLVLHESVFINQDKYYWYKNTGARTPIADHIICWGQLQKNIFIKRGVNPDKIKVLGSPKLDAYYNYTPSLSENNFFKAYGLKSSVKTILFAAQSMDHQLKESSAWKKQTEALCDVMDYCDNHKYQLIIRDAPIAKNVIHHREKKRISNNPRFHLDHFTRYLSTPEDSIYHCDALISVNSTMLLESLLMNKVAISAKYIEFDQIWQNIGLPYATNRNSLFEQLDDLLKNGLSIDKEKWQWAEDNFSVGCFDGQSAERIKAYLERPLT